MAIKRIKIERLTTTNSYMGLGSLRFYDKDMNLYQSGNLIKYTDAYKGESDNFYAEVSAGHYDADWNAIEALYTGTTFSNVGSYRYFTNAGNYDSQWFNVIFKVPVETIGMIQMDIAPNTDTLTNSPLKISVYDENDELIITYQVNPIEHFPERTRFRYIHLLTPELTEKPKYMVLSDVQASGTKNYVIKEIEVDAVPWYGSKKYDEVIRKLDCSANYSTYYPENVFMQWEKKAYNYYTYYQSKSNPNGLTNVLFGIEFNAPKLLNAVEFATYADSFARNLKFTVEALDEITNEWIVLKSYESEREPQYDFVRVDFENSNYYFKYRLRVINVYAGGTPFTTNAMRWIEKQRLIQEVSIATADDYKNKGMKSFKTIGTNNIKKSVVIPSKVSFGNGYTFTKKFDLTTEKIRSITI